MQNNPTQVHIVYVKSETVNLVFGWNILVNHIIKPKINWLKENKYVVKKENLIKLNIYSNSWQGAIYINSVMSGKNIHSTNNNLGCFRKG